MQLIQQRKAEAKRWLSSSNSSSLSFSLLQPKAAAVTKKPASTPYKKGGAKATKNPLFEKKSRSFGIGKCWKRQQGMEHGGLWK